MEMAGSYGGPSEQQWLLLLDLVSHDSELRTGQFTGPMGKRRVERKWNEVAAQLNAIPGSNKTGRLWKEAYANLKQRARKAYSDRLNYIRGTGGGEEPDLAGMGISDVYMKCLSICGTVTASGNLSVPNALQMRREATRRVDNGLSAPQAPARPTITAAHGASQPMPCALAAQVAQQPSPTGTHHTFPVDHQVQGPYRSPNTVRRRYGQHQSPGLGRYGHQSPIRYGHQPHSPGFIRYQHQVHSPGFGSRRYAPYPADHSPGGVDHHHYRYRRPVSPNGPLQRRLDEKRDERRDSPRRSLFTDNRANNASAGNDHNREGGDGIAPLCTGSSWTEVRVEGLLNSLSVLLDAVLGIMPALTRLFSESVEGQVQRILDALQQNNQVFIIPGQAEADEPTSN